MQDDDLGKCNGVEGRYDLDRERALKSLLEKAKILPRMAKKLRTSNYKGQGCYTDILILVVQNVAFCHEGSKAVFFGVEPLMGLSFSPRVKRLLAETTASNLEQSRRRWKIDPTNTDLHTSDHGPKKPKHSIPAAINCHNRNCVINMIRRIMQVLDDGLPPLSDAEYRQDEPDKSEQSGQEEENGERRSTESPKSPITWFAHPQHTIPAWALIAFAVSLGVTLFCACLGHWVNTGRSRLHVSSDAASAAKYHLHNRRWRAGFGGGMLELHNTVQQKGGGGGMGGSGGFGAPSRTGGLPQRTTRAKMFGGMGMGPASARSRQANGAQHSYHRV